MKIILDGIIESLNTRSDGSVAVKFSTQECDSSKAGELFSLRGKYCKALFSDSNITELEAETVDKTQLTGTRKRTPSIRLRSVLFVLHEQQGYQIPFEDYYSTEIERIIQHYKNKLQ